VIYLLPNLITTAALMLGFWSITLSIRGDFERAGLAIVLAAFADTLDGRIARATRSTSSFGVEYDSMSDLVSFGLAPALLFYNWTLIPLGPRGWLIAALFALCAALRLARFNVKAHVKEQLHYEGLPSTFAGGFVAVCVWFTSWLGLEPPFSPVLSMLVTGGFAVVALLMVSPVPYPSLRSIKIEGKRVYPTLVAIVLFAVAILLNHEPMMFGLGVTFVLSGPVYWLILRRREQADAIEEASSETRGDVR
jgi:CDP-diacylglycerol--serine O-phosphatidyltransferase